MRKIWNYVKWQFINDFHPGQYAAIGLFLALAIALNYAFDFHDRFLSPIEGIYGLLAYCVFYAVPYYFCVAIIAYFQRDGQIFRDRQFWIRSALAIVVLALDGSMPYVRELINRMVHPSVQFWALKVAFNAMSFFTVMLPLLVFYLWQDRSERHIYGLRPRKFDARPYLTMLAIVLPILILASFHESFLRQYPMYKVTGAHVHMGVAEWVTVAIYELAYGLDFVTVEFFFRGFLVLGMLTVLGRKAVLPMAVVYCFLHFGKPAGEAISSIAGGYILGVIAYETKSVWGGVIVHMGIAWLMEGIAFIQKNFL